MRCHSLEQTTPPAPFKGTGPFTWWRGLPSLAKEGSCSRSQHTGQMAKPQTTAFSRGYTLSPLRGCGYQGRLTPNLPIETRPLPSRTGTRRLFDSLYTLRHSPYDKSTM